MPTEDPRERLASETAKALAYEKYSQDLMREGNWSDAEALHLKAHENAAAALRDAQQINPSDPAAALSNHFDRTSQYRGEEGKRNLQSDLQAIATDKTMGVMSEDMYGQYSDAIPMRGNTGLTRDERQEVRQAMVRIGNEEQVTNRRDSIEIRDELRNLEAQNRTWANDPNNHWKSTGLAREHADHLKVLADTKEIPPESHSAEHPRHVTHRSASSPTASNLVSTRDENPGSSGTTERPMSELSTEDRQAIERIAQDIKLHNSGDGKSAPMDERQATAVVAQLSETLKDVHMDEVRSQVTRGVRDIASTIGLG